MTISEMERFCQKEHDQRVSKLLSDNMDLLFCKPVTAAISLSCSSSIHASDAWANSNNLIQIFENFQEILNIEKNTKHYDYYAFFIVDFLFHSSLIHDRHFSEKLRSLKNGQKHPSEYILYKYLLDFLEPLVMKIENGESIARISSASIYGMMAALLVGAGASYSGYGSQPVNYLSYDKNVPSYLKRQYFGYDLSDSFLGQIDGERMYRDLIKKGMRIDPNDKYCTFALFVYCTKDNIQQYDKGKYFVNKCGLMERPVLKKRIELLFAENSRKWRDKARQENEMKKYEMNKANSNHGNIEMNDFGNYAKYFALNKKYEQGLAVFDEAKRWHLMKHKDEKIRFKGPPLWDSMRFEYIVKYGYNFEEIEKSETMLRDEFNSLFVFYYLPDYIRSDPVVPNELHPTSESVWMMLGGYKYDKTLGDKCKTHSFLYPFCNVSKKTKILNEWADDEEYDIKWKYSLNELLGIIDEGAAELNEDNVDILLKEKENGDDIPLFWDCVLMVWSAMAIYDADALILGPLTMGHRWDMLERVFSKIVPIFDYIGKHAYMYRTDKNIDKIFDKLCQLWRSNKINGQLKHAQFCYKMIELMVENATLLKSNYQDDDEKKEESDHDAEKKQFEGQVKILQFLNMNGGWLNDGKDGPIKRGDIMENIKSKYQKKLNELGSVLTDYYNNDLFNHPNYDKLICDDIKNPLDEELILRQDKKSVLQRCRWGPLENDTINEQRYNEELKTKYGLIPVPNLNVEPVSNSFKNAYIDFVLKVGEKLQIPFQKDMRELFEKNTNGQYFEAPIKKFQRCLQKIDYDYKNETKPVGAHILDIVRCLVVYENITDLVAAYNLLTSKYKVCRLKNNFIKTAEVFGNYRCLMVNILYEHPTNANIKMIVEVQLTLKKVYLVRLTMHKTYKLFRAVLPEDDALLF
eukprot:120786_1